MFGIFWTHPDPAQNYFSKFTWIYNCVIILIPYSDVLDHVKGIEENQVIESFEIMQNVWDKTNIWSIGWNKNFIRNDNK